MSTSKPPMRYALLVAALMQLLPVAAYAAKADKDEDAGKLCEDCPDESGRSGWAEGGIGIQSDDAYHFGRYSGLEEHGAAILISSEVRHRGKTDGAYLDGKFDNLGLESRRLGVEGGRQGKYGVAVEYDQIQSKIAASYLYSGNGKRAGELAAASLKRSGKYVPMAGWVAGLAAWENGEYKKSAAAFEIPATSDYASGWTAAAASYWAARAHMRAGNVRVVSKWLEVGMEHPRTFYGLIATRSLGRDFDFNWKVPTFTKNYFDTLMKTDSGNRAIALVAAGQPHLAENELIRMKPEDDNMRDALLAYAGYADLPSLGMRLASLVSDEAGAFYDAALYPTGPWKPEEGYKIDPALIYAITRQESKFDPLAKSSAGAVGLMQVMPSTASSIVEDPSLTNPQENLEVAQRYLENLLKDKSVQGDMVMLLIAYNAGPGNLAKWKKQWPEVKDPLLFIELIPSSETRAYVERVLANFWIYRLKDGQPTPTLDSLATGKIAKYTHNNVSEHKGPYQTASAQ